jgi:hypothetical protein
MTFEKNDYHAPKNLDDEGGPSQICQELIFSAIA